MKIGILTQPLHNNYGGLLQNYALQTVLKRMGHEVWTIDRQFKETSLFRKFGSSIKRQLLKPLIKNQPIRVWQTKKEKAIIAKNTAQFIKENIKTTHKITSSAKMSNLSNYKFNAYIVGSDQVWRPEYSPCITNYFLDFVENEVNLKKIAYSASFGTDSWEFTPKEEARCSELIKKFNAVSVREDSAIELCKIHFNHTVIAQLDPTLLLCKCDYESLVHKAGVKESAGNMFVYFLDKDTFKNNVVETITNKVGLTPFEVMPKKKFAEMKKKEIDLCIFPPVEQWLRAFMDAEFIVTDSFHGTVFSIIFEKPFIVIGNEERGLARFDSLLKLFCLENRLVFQNNYKSISSLIEKKNDYSSVTHILNNKRNEGLDFLKHNLSTNS